MAFYGTNWTGNPELHVIRDVSHGGMPSYFFDTPENPGTQRYNEDGTPVYSEGSAFGAHPEDYSPAGFSGLFDLNTIRQQWGQTFPGVPFPDVSSATPGTGTNAQGNPTPGTFNGMEMTERGNSGHGSWMDQQGGELISDALFAGAGYTGGPVANALMSYGLGGDTSAESQRSLRAGALGGVAGSIFGTPSTSASDTPASNSSAPINGSTGASTGGNMGFYDDYGNWVDTAPDAGLNGGGGLYGSNVDEFGNPISSNFEGGNTNDFFNPSAGGMPSLSASDLKYLTMLKTLFGGGNRAGGNNNVFGGASGPGSATGDSSLAALLAALAGGYGLMQGQRGVPQEVQPLLNAGNQTYQTALDPQGELYGRTSQHVQDASRAATSARGVGMSPYSAGVENDAMRNFNIDWQNQQLGRQATGVGAMTGATNAAVGAAGFGAGQNASNVNALLSGVSGLQNSYNTPGSWLNNLFNG